MAHYRSVDFDHFYRRVSIGQLLLMDYNAIEYIKLTNPWGSSEEEGKPSRSREPKGISPTVDDSHRIIATKMRGKAKMIRTTKENLEPHLAAFAEDLEKGRDGRQ